MKREKLTKNAVFIGLSLALHLLLFFAFIWVNDFLFFNELYKRLNHTVIDRTKDLSAQIELVDIKEKSKQIVEQDKTSLNKVKPKDAKFLSAEDQSVKKQTKAALNGAFKNSNPSPSSAPTISFSDLLEESLQSGGDNQKDRPSKLGLKGLNPELDPNKRMQRKLEQAKTLARISPGRLGRGPSQTDDFLEDIELGRYTLLNTQKYEFFSYFSRVKGQLRSHWSPKIREQISILFYTSQLRSPSSLDRKKTYLKITLNKSGYLENIELLTTSGNNSIDTAAIQAFQDAQPFLNPPKELLEKDKKIRFFWAFILES